ncbi:OTU domain-containing protein [Pseudomonas sp. T1.Ur]|uniref:OTU domain-containing protein n=1 Tax=Pseudomonas sp. T1.Ur TaxID=2928704 RepID=UPI00201E3D16|nr:OTU domain-containing protein [Pseudomonas sp. T1.Ur]MCL6703585.1 hypothetical protein [Pseudomonas sp. T1.Ur]
MNAITEPSSLTTALRPITPLPNGQPFAPHPFSDQWLSERGLRGDEPVLVTYQEVETVDSAARSKRASMPLRAVVTQGFLIAHQSQEIHPPAAASPREGWSYPHISHLSVDFSSLRFDGKVLSEDQIQPLRRGIASDYRSTVEPFSPTTVDPPGHPLTARQQEQIKQLARLDDNEMELARLFARLPTFDSMLQDQLASAIEARIPERKFRPSLFQAIDPQRWSVNHFSTDAAGVRTLTTSQRFIEVLRGALLKNAPPSYTVGHVGFFTRPDTVEEADSVFATPVDPDTLQAMASVFHIAQPTTSGRIKDGLREAFRRFRNSTFPADAAATTRPYTTQAQFARLLAQRFLHLLELSKADRPAISQLSQGARRVQYDEDLMLDRITTHPSRADRSRLLRPPVPQVFAVMLDRGNAPAQKWPGAMVIKQTDLTALYLYSLETGLLRFASFQALVDQVRPTLEAQPATIRDIDTELTGHAFEIAADDLLNLQAATLEKVLSAAQNATLALADFAQNAEEALSLPQLSLAGPLATRQQTLIEHNRPDAYKTATLSQQQHYRRLEERVFQTAYGLGSGIPTLEQFTRLQIKQYLSQTMHPGLDPDPDKTQVTLFFGSTDNPRQSATTSLTQLVLDNLRPDKYPTPVELLPTHLIDRQDQRLRNPANGYFIQLPPQELGRLVSSIDAGARYDAMLREQMNTPAYKTAWQAAYLATMKFKAYEATLRGNEVFGEHVTDPSNRSTASSKLLPLWLEAIFQQGSPAAYTRLVRGKQVLIHGLVLGGSMGVGGQHGNMAGSASVDGSLIFTDQPGPDIKGTVGIYFPDSPGGEDFHEFSDLAEGIAGLLRQEPWRAYLRSRMSIRTPEYLERLLGQRGARPLIRAVAYSGDWLDALHRTHVEFQGAYANERSISNLELVRQTQARIAMTAFEGVVDVLSMLLAPGFQTVGNALRIGAWMVKSGGVRPDQLKFIAAYYKGRGQAVERVVASRGQSSFKAVGPRQHDRGSVLAGLPLETSVYGRYAVTDTSVIRGLSADAQGFYRTATAVYIRQPDGTVLRVHDHTRLGATEANLVDPTTGLGLRSSGVMRSTVARMSTGEWRAVGFGHGGGGRKRPPSHPPKPDTPPAKVPAVTPSSVSNSIRTPGNWDNDIMDMVPAIITRIPHWPSLRSLLIIDEIRPSHHWSVRFTPGQAERGYPLGTHPDRLATDIVLRRTTRNHYDLILGDRVVAIAPDGDCFFNAIARGLNEGNEAVFTAQGLRNAAADYIDQHPQLTQYVVTPPPRALQGLFEHAPSLQVLLQTDTLRDLTQAINGAPYPPGLFQPIRTYLNRWPSGSALIQPLGVDVLSRISERLAASLINPARQDRQMVQRFLREFLLQPVQDSEITDLLDTADLLLSKAVVHIMLEYGVTARQLKHHHPKPQQAYIKWDEATHGHLNAEQLIELVGNRKLVGKHEWAWAAHILLQLKGERVTDEARLFLLAVQYLQVEETLKLLMSTLERFPALLERANILLHSPLVSYLAGTLYLGQVATWIRDTTLSNRRLAIISDYVSLRYDEAAVHQNVDIDWMRFFDDRTVENIIAARGLLTTLFERLNETTSTGATYRPPFTALFSPPGLIPSNSRVALLFEIRGFRPTLWHALWHLESSLANEIWSEIISPRLSHDEIRRLLGPEGRLRLEIERAGMRPPSPTEE